MTFAEIQSALQRLKERINQANPPLDPITTLIILDWLNDGQSGVEAVSLLLGGDE